MAIMVTPAEAVEDPVAMAEAVVLGAIAIPGRGEQVRVARAFVARVLRKLAESDEAVPDEPVLDESVLDNATLLTSELVTNAIRHSRSGESGGSVGLTSHSRPRYITAMRSLTAFTTARSWAMNSRVRP